MSLDISGFWEKCFSKGAYLFGSDSSTTNMLDQMTKYDNDLISSTKL